MIKGLLINVEDGTVKSVELKEDFREIQKLLNVDIYTVTRRRICGKLYAFCCDDEGLLKSEPTISAVSFRADYDLLVGNLLITRERPTRDGIKMESLSDEDFEILMSRMRQYFKGGKDIPVLVFD